MFIIHGRRNRTHDHGYVLQLTCDRCKNPGWWKLIQETESKTLYFTSISSNDRYHLFCEKCGNSIELNMDQTQRAFHLRDSTLMFFNKQIPEAEYTRRLQECRYLQ